MHEHTDEQLMVEALAGDRVALSALLARHYALLLGYLYRLVDGDRQLAEDLVQETLLRVLKQGTLRGDRPFKPWLYLIATNLARDHFKSAAVRHRGGGNEEDAVLLTVPDATLGPEDLAVVNEEGGEVRAALAQLGESHRLVVVLRFYQGFSLQEIADTLQIPLGTVKSRLSIALQRLHAALDPLQEGVE